MVSARAFSGFLQLLLFCRLSQKKPPVYFTLGVVMAAGEK